MAALSLFQDKVDKREFHCEVKMIGDTDSPGTIEGIASVFSNIDRQNEIILPGAFQKTLADFHTHGFLAYGHEWTDPIGTIDEAKETSEGLYFRSTFHSTAPAQLIRTVVLERLARGKSIGLSIGFQTKEWERDEKSGVRSLKEVELFEVSIVTVPANPLARVAGAKAIDADLEAELEARRIEMRRIQIQLLASSELIRRL